MRLIDKSKNKGIYIYIPASVTDTESQGNAYTKFRSTVRKVLSFTTGIVSMQNREALTSKKEEADGINQLPMIDLKTGRDTIIGHGSIFTNMSYVCTENKNFVLFQSLDHFSKI